MGFYRALFYFAVLCCVINVATAKPKAIIYIGPYKTGSSTIAEYFYRMKSLLQSQNIYLPESECTQKKKDSSILSCLGEVLKSIKGGALRSLTDIRNNSRSLHCTITCVEFENFVSKHKNTNNTIVFGHEVYSSHMHQEVIKQIFAVLEGYDVWFVSVYRPLTSRMFSYQGQTHRKDTKFKLVYFDEYYDKVKHGQGQYLDTYFVTNIVTSLVNRKFLSGEYDTNNRLFLIDFFNALKNHMEPHQVMHCDVLQLCPNASLKPGSLNANGHRDRFGKYDQLFYNFRMYVEDQNCELLENSKHYIEEDEYWTAFNNKETIIPYRIATCEEAKRDAVETSNVLYGLQKLYPDEVTWLYANETLSLDSINNFRYQEVDRGICAHDKRYIGIFYDMLSIGVRRREITCK